MADAARWEKWEAQMRLGIDLSRVLREYDPSSFPKYNEEVSRRSVAPVGSQPGAAVNGKHKVLLQVECAVSFQPLCFRLALSLFLSLAMLSCPTMHLFHLSDTF